MASNEDWLILARVSLTNHRGLVPPAVTYAWAL